MSNYNENTSKAVAAASGARDGGSDSNWLRSAYRPDWPPRKRLIVMALGPDGSRFTVTGQNAKTLLALVKAGAKGVTALDVAAWAFRLSQYVLILRRRHRLSIETLLDEHEGGKHARYVLRSSVTILQPVSR